MSKSIILRKSEDFGPAFRESRRERKRTQEHIAELNNMSRFTLAKAEGGKTDPKLSTVIELLRSLGLTLVAVPSAVADRISYPEIPTELPEIDEGEDWELFGGQS